MVFQDDGTMRVIDSVSEANREYEAVDVENQIYVFIDERGYLLKPVLAEPATKRLLFFSVSDTVPFKLEPTNERRDDLLARLQTGEIPIDQSSSGVRTIDDLRQKAPQLFAPK